MLKTDGNIGFLGTKLCKKNTYNTNFNKRESSGKIYCPEKGECLR
jgi:hypothetical protein